MKKILWISRHKPLPSQILELAKIFGEVKIIQDSQPFSGADEIVKRFKDGKFDEMVVVAPLSVIAKLTEKGIKPLWAEMRQVPEKEAEVIVSGRGYRFVKFRRIKTVKIEFEEI
jgi:hypothetical protein